MRVVFLGLILACTLLGGPAQAAQPQMCGSGRLTTALHYLDWHEKNLNYNQMARTEALRDASEVHTFAKVTAAASTFVFLICLAVLVGAITLRLADSMKLAAGLSSIYFVFFGFVIFYSPEPIREVIQDFRAEANTLQIQNLPSDLRGPGGLHEFMAMLSREQSRVPEIFGEKATYLPSQSRWWTLGWDDVGLIDFQNEAFKALIRKGNFSLRAISVIREDLERKCRESGMQI